MQQYFSEVDFSLLQRKPGVGIPTAGSQPALPGLEKQPRSRRRRRPRPVQRITTPYSITGANDCEIIGHAEGLRDLAGCTTCVDCGVKIFCPACIPQHPTDPQAIALYCSRHERQEHHESIS